MPRDQNAYIRKLYFNTGDNVNILVTVSYPIATSTLPLVNLKLARLNSTFGVVMYRNPNNNFQLSAALVDTSGASGSAIVIWPATSLSSGTGKSFGLFVNVDTVRSDRMVFVYNDGYNQAYVQDAGVYGSTIVLGR